MAQINKPSDYFNTVLYTGNGATDTAQTGVGFQPDWTWIKARSIGYDNNLFDVVRGSTKRLIANATTAETTQTEMIKSFDSDGFTLGNDAGVNANTETFASWNWLADNTSGSANTDGSISSTVSASTTSGFSIVTYDGTGSAGATVGHGLGVAPSMILAKKMDGAASNWAVYHKSLGATKYLILNSTTASVTSNTRWNNVEPTSSVFTVGSSGDVNNNGETVVAYCFAEKKGYSKFGSYTGNNLDDGTFCYTGMKPSFVMIKRTDSTSEWNIYDVKRNPFNLTNLELEANTSDAEANVSEREIDILSNGFKLRGRSTFINAPGGSYIYMAFAENPFVTSTGIPTTAR